MTNSSLITLIVIDMIRSTPAFALIVTACALTILGTSAQRPCSPAEKTECVTTVLKEVSLCSAGDKRDGLFLCVVRAIRKGRDCIAACGGVARNTSPDANFFNNTTISQAYSEFGLVTPSSADFEAAGLCQIACNGAYEAANLACKQLPGFLQGACRSAANVARNACLAAC